MPGPLPKDPAKRQRRNKSATRALLPAEENPIKRAPSLPTIEGREWSPLTVRWWRDIWRSPQRAEFLRADLASLFRLVVLVDMFWVSFDLEIAREIRLLEREFGFTPLSRRRLEWSIAQTEEAKDKHVMNRARRAKKIVDSADPREAL